jgi:hypothetical protein
MARSEEAKALVSGSMTSRRMTIFCIDDRRTNLTNAKEMASAFSRCFGFIAKVPMPRCAFWLGKVQDFSQRRCAPVTTRSSTQDG